MSNGGSASAEPDEPRRTDVELDQETTRLYRDHWHRIRGFLRSLGCPESCLDDICQDAFLAVRLRMSQTDIESPEAYLYRVARNRFHRLHGKREAREILCDRPVDERPAESFDSAIVRRHALRATFDRLSRRQQQVLFLRNDIDLSVRQTAELLDIAEGTVKKAMSETRDRLGEFLRADPETWAEEL